MMTEYSRSSYMGMYGHMGDFNDTSAMSRMQQQYWTTKQAVFKKLGKKNDDCIVASDLELDLKLELFQTIEESFLTLMRVLENYQDKLCGLAQEENALGRFLKENGKQDKTRAGKAMASAGKALSYSAQQRLTLRIPLVRLYQEVETFQYRAIVDTLKTVEKMEKARTAYRGTLMWMKDVSQQLDPDTCKQMEKFRKVQSQVRFSKLLFDKLKVDTLQKIDLLSFSRCNLFSQALAAYQNALINICQKISSTSNSVAANTKGYQHYEFCMLKELTETSRKLAEETSDLKSVPSADKDTTLFFDSEYHDDEDGRTAVEKSKTAEKFNKGNGSCKDSESVTNLFDNSPETANEDLINLSNVDREKYDHNQEHIFTAEHRNFLNRTNDFVTDASEIQNSGNDELLFLNDIVNASNGNIPDISDLDGSFMTEWQAVFGNEESPTKSPISSENSRKIPKSLPSFLPSQLLNTDELKETQINSEELTSLTSKDNVNETRNDVSNSKNSTATDKKSSKGKQDMSAWFSLFADLDPLANPDLVGKKKEKPTEGSC